jgi:hypothetical protein
MLHEPQMQEITDVPNIALLAERKKHSITIDDGEVLSGSLPTSKMKFVQAWIEIHKEDLMADWKLAVAGEPVFKIDPLK